MSAPETIGLGLTRVRFRITGVRVRGNREPRALRASTQVMPDNCVRVRITGVRVRGNRALSAIPAYFGVLKPS